jgi:hypothetical protein
LCTLSIILLAACELGPNRNVAATPDSKAGEPINATTAAGYPAPGTPVVPVVPTAAPTALATAPIVVPAPSGQLVGAEWTLLYQGDLNADGKPDVVGIKLAQNVKPNTTFQQPGYSAYKGPATEVVIVQAGADGKPQIQALFTQAGVSAAGASLASFTNPAALMTSVVPGSRPLVSIWAIDAAGAPQGRAVGLEWNAAQGSYILFGGLAK